jgi:hypothetical protein
MLDADHQPAFLYHVSNSVDDIEEFQDENVNLRIVYKWIVKNKIRLPYWQIITGYPMNSKLILQYKNNMNEKTYLPTFIIPSP